MEQLIRNITKKFTNLLPGDKLFFTPDDLREYDIPEFLVLRIEVEIYRNLNESIVPPHSEWADMAAEDVEYAWEHFIDAIIEKVRMPASYASSVFETSVADVVEMILQPRKAIPSILFGPEKKLKKNNLQKMKRFVTINTHLADAILKYMDRREKEKLDINTCKQIIERVDDRLTQNYNSLNWAQHLQPLFILAGPKVDSELFRIFFEDKNLPRVSRRFDLLNDSLDKTRFIEILSSPNLLNEEIGEEDQSNDVATEQAGNEEKKKSPNSKSSDLPAEEEYKPIARREPGKELSPKNIPDYSSTRSEDEKQQLFEPDSDKDDTETDDYEDTLLTSFQSRLRSGDEPWDDEEPDIAKSDTDQSMYGEVPESDEEELKNDSETPLHRKFISDDDDEEEYDDDLDYQIWNYQDETEEEKTFSAQFSEEEEYKEESEPEMDIPAKPEKFRQENKNEFETGYESDEDDIDEVFLFGERTQLREETETNEKAEIKEETERSNDRPIWQSFLGDEDNIEEDEIEEPKYSPFAELEDEDDPILDLVRKAEKEENVLKLAKWLDKDEKRFVDSIFNGSKTEYKKALITLDDFNNWNQAGSFIEKEIFTQNHVDIYDEDAVIFIDRMQAYFDEFKS